MEIPIKLQVERRAYELWQQAGEPNGRDQEFYHQAEKELQEADEKNPSHRIPDNL
jgi:hypothetical protein